MPRLPHQRQENRAGRNSAQASTGAAAVGGGRGSMGAGRGGRGGGRGGRAGGAGRQAHLPNINYNPPPSPPPRPPQNPNDDYQPPASDAESSELSEVPDLFAAQHLIDDELMEIEAVDAPPPAPGVNDIALAAELRAFQRQRAQELRQGQAANAGQQDVIELLGTDSSEDDGEFPARTVRGAWIELDGAQTCIFQAGYDWKRAARKLQKAVRHPDSSTRNSEAKKAMKMGSTEARPEILEARREFFISRGIPIMTLNVETRKHLGLISKLEATKESKKGSGVIEYVSDPRLICSPCLKRIAKGEEDVHCTAFKPFTSCSNCPNNNRGCDFADLQKYHIAATVTGAGERFKQINADLLRMLGQTDGMAMAIDVSGACNALLQCVDIGLPGTHARLNSWFKAQQTALANNTRTGQTHQGLIMGSRGQQLASAMNEARRQDSRPGPSQRDQGGDYYTGMRLLNQAFVNAVSPEKPPASSSRLAIRAQSPSPRPATFPGNLSFGNVDPDEHAAFQAWKKEKRQEREARLDAQAALDKRQSDLAKLVFDKRARVDEASDDQPVASGSGNKGKGKGPIVSPPNSDIDE